MRIKKALNLEWDEIPKAAQEFITERCQVNSSAEELSGWMMQDIRNALVVEEKSLKTIYEETKEAIKKNGDSDTFNKKEELKVLEEHFKDILACIEREQAKAKETGNEAEAENPMGAFSEEEKEQGKEQEQETGKEFVPPSEKQIEWAQKRGLEITEDMDRRAVSRMIKKHIEDRNNEPMTEAQREECRRLGIEFEEDAKKQTMRRVIATSKKVRSEISASMDTAKHMHTDTFEQGQSVAVNGNVGLAQRDARAKIPSDLQKQYAEENSIPYSERDTSYSLGAKIGIHKKSQAGHEAEQGNERSRELTMER